MLTLLFSNEGSSGGQCVIWWPRLPDPEDQDQDQDQGPPCEARILTAEGYLDHYGHSASVSAIEFDQKGNYLVSASGDYTAIIWSVSGTCTCSVHTIPYLFSSIPG